MVSETIKTLFKDQISHISDHAGIPDYDSFPRWICQNVLGVTDEGEIDEAVSIGGKDDHGIGIFYVDDGTYSGEQAIYMIQAKFNENLDHVVTRAEIESFTGEMGRMRRCPEGANTVFKQKSMFLKRTEAQYPNIRKYMIFAVTGKPDAHIDGLIRNDEWRQEKKVTSSNNTYLDILDIDKILSYVTSPPTPGIKIKFEGQVIKRTDKFTGRDSVVGYIDAEQLVKLSEQNRETIFLDNPRQSLGNTVPTHKAILDTLSRDVGRQRFWKLNNGITSVCEGFEKITDTEYQMKNFRIVNGRHTIYTLKKSTHPLDDVCLLMAVHGAIDGDERNQISEATNTQNPTKPADLVTNYSEMIELAMQCKKDYPEFYFERQTKGFRSSNTALQNRVTLRRLMEKNATARSYYAYTISPNGAMISDKELFSTGDPNHYAKVFKDRNVKDLILPHIFRKLLDELHRKWCSDLNSKPSDEVARDKDIISKDIVKYFVLRFIFETMTSIGNSERERISDGIIEKFRSLKKKDPVPEGFLTVAENAYNTFMLGFDNIRNETWPKEIMDRINHPDYVEQPEDMPDSYDVMYVLKQKGQKLLPHLLRTRQQIIRLQGDALKDSILALVQDSNS